MSKRDTQQKLVPRLRFPEFRTGKPWLQKPLGEMTDPITERVGDSDCVPFTVTTGEGLVSQEEKYGRTIAGKSLRNYYRLRPDDFAFNKSATKLFPQGYIARFQGNEHAAVPNSIFTCFRIADDNVDAAFLDYMFQGNLHGRWLKDYITVGARAHGALNISDHDLYALPIPLPPGERTLAEQRKIADCLGSLDDLIAAEGRKLEALREHKQGLMEQLFPREGETRPRLRFPAFRNAPAWKLQPMRKLGAFLRGLTYKSSDVTEKGLLVLRSTNIQAGRLTCDENLVFVSRDCPDELLLRPGDVAICMSNGSKALVGKSGEYLGDYKHKVTVGAFCSIFRPATPFAKLAFSTPKYSRFVANEIAGGNINNLKNSDLEEFEFPVPDNPGEQQRIADCLSALENRIAAQADKLDALRSHKRGLMQQLFPSPENAEA